MTKYFLRLMIVFMRLMLMRGNPRVVRQFVDNFGEGGLEQVVLDLHIELQKQGVDSKILVWDAVSPVMRASVPNPSDLIELCRDRVALFTHLRRNRVGTVNWHYSTTSQRLIRLAGVRTVYTLHNSYTWLDYGEARQRHRRITRFHTVVAVSNSVREYFLARNSLYSNRLVVVAVISNGVDHLNMPRRSPFALDGGILNAAVVSNFHHVKALSSLVGLSEELSRRGLSIRFHVFGGPLESEHGEALKSLIDKRGLADRIVLRGRTAHPEVIRSLASSKFALFVSPSLQEGCSIALLEAVCIGVPVVTTSTGNAESCAQVSQSVKTVALPFSSPLLLNPVRIAELGNSTQLENVVEFADAIEWIAKDPAEAISIAVESADRFRELFSVLTMVDAYRAIYRLRNRTPD